MQDSFTFETDALPACLKTDGMFQLARSVQSADGVTVLPFSGQRFLCLDDAWSLDRRGRRLQPTLAHRFTDLIVESPRSGSPTIAADGAMLSYQGARLRKGQRLSFAWQFLAWGEYPWNDFACFEAEPDELTQRGIERQVLMDLAELSQTGGRVSGWRLYEWEATEDFTGTLRWLVANGQAQTNLQLTQPSSDAFSYPSVLLLDNICVHAPREHV